MKKSILFLALLMIGSLAFAQRHGESMQRHDRNGGRFHRDFKAQIAERLDLTEDQQAKVEELRMTHLKTTTATKNELKIKEAELHAAISAENADRQKVDQLVKEINNLKGTLFAERISHQLEVRSVLSDEQKLKFDQVRERMGDRSRMGKRG